MRVTLAQISPKLNRSNLKTVLEIVNEMKESSDLIVFPELSLNGYMLQDKLFEDAWYLDELQELFTASLHVDIVVGAAMREGDVFRNSALYFSKGELLNKHDKIHLPNYGMFEEARYFNAGNRIDTYINNNRKISMLVCEDLWHTSIHEELKRANPDYIIALVASPARGFSDEGLEIEKQWYTIIKKVAKECHATVLFVNRVGFEDGLGFWGGSCIVNEKAEIIHRLAHYETLVETFDI